jgi:hypothetical protein
MNTIRKIFQVAMLIESLKIFLKIKCTSTHGTTLSSSKQTYVEHTTIVSNLSKQTLWAVEG